MRNNREEARIFLRGTYEEPSGWLRAYLRAEVEPGEEPRVFDIMIVADDMVVEKKEAVSADTAFRLIEQWCGDPCQIRWRWDRGLPDGSAVLPVVYVR